MSKRGPAHVWKRFWSLEIGEVFFIRSNQRAVKMSIAGYQEHAKAARTPEEWGKQTPVRIIAPWRKVRTTMLRYSIKGTETGRRVTATECKQAFESQPVVISVSPLDALKKMNEILAEANRVEEIGAANTGKSESYGKLLAGKLLAENPGKTHFLGDDCPGGHYNGGVAPENPIQSPNYYDKNPESSMANEDTK